VALHLDSNLPSNGSPCVSCSGVDCGRYLISTIATIQFFFGISARGPRIPENIKSLIPSQIPTWGAKRGNETVAKATWLGYAYSPSRNGPSMILKRYTLTVMPATSLNYPHPLVRPAAFVSFSTLYSPNVVLRPVGLGLHALRVWLSHELQLHDPRPHASLCHTIRCAL
jgi:hypothetical protein